MAITIQLPPLRTLIGIAVGLAVLISAYAVYDFQPKRQLKKAHHKLMTAAEARDWNRVGELVAESYHDASGLTKSTAVASAREVFANFLVLGVEAPADSVTVQAESGSVSAVIRLTGSGNPIAQMVIEQVNVVQTPFVFRWQKQSWKPWDWQLTEVQPPEELVSASRSL
jgi:hypothetical protein